MSVTTRTIFKADGIKAIYQPGRSDFLVISFNGLGFNEPGERFFGDRFFAKRGIAAVGLVDHRASWYCLPQVLDAIAAVNARLVGEYPIRLTYGASMGAYAALKYARALHAHAALAFGPQASIVPSRVGAFDQRYARFYERAIHSGMEVMEADLCDRNYVFYDPSSPFDTGHVNLLPDPAIRRIKSPFIGHPGVLFFTQVRLIEEVFAVAAQPDPPPARFRQLVRAKRRQASDYWFNRAEYMRNQRTPKPVDAIIDSFRRALAANRDLPDHPDTLKSMVGLADTLIDAGRTREARSYIEKLWTISAKGAQIAGFLQLLLKVRSFDRARALATRATERDPKNSDAQLELAKLFLMTGDLAGANEAADRARDYARHSPLTWRRLRWIYDRLGRQDEVAAVDQMIKKLGVKPPPTREQSRQAGAVPVA